MKATWCPSATASQHYRARCESGFFNPLLSCHNMWVKKEDAAMAEERAQMRFGEMIALWQGMMREGFEMMLKAPAEKDLRPLLKPSLVNPHSVSN